MSKSIQYDTWMILGGTHAFKHGNKIVNWDLCLFFKVPLSNYRHNLFFIDTESLGELSFHLYSEMLAIPFYAKELSERIENVYEHKPQMIWLPFSSSLHPLSEISRYKLKTLCQPWHRIWHARVALFVILFLVVGMYVCSNTKLFKVVERGSPRICVGRVGNPSLCILNITLCILVACRVSKCAPLDEHRCFNIWYFLWARLCDDQRWRQPWNASLNLHIECINERK